MFAFEERKKKCEQKGFRYCLIGFKTHSTVAHIFFLLNINAERTKSISLARCQSKGLSPVHFYSSSHHSHPIIFPNTSHSICETCRDFIIHLRDKLYTHIKKFASHTIRKTRNCHVKVFAAAAAFSRSLFFS